MHLDSIMVNLQDDLLSKQEDKALAIRKRFEERTVRFLNAKQRTIGIDKQYLDRQVQEKNEERIKEMESMKHEAIIQDDISQYLRQRDEVAQEVRRAERADVHETILEQMKMPKNNALGKGDPLDLNSCGPSSLQRFDGEDPEHGMRKKIQQEQQRKWFTQQIRERMAAREKEHEAEQKYAEYVLAEDAARYQNAQEEERLRADVTTSVKNENLKMASERKQSYSLKREEDEKLEELETTYVQTSPFFSEDTRYSKSCLANHRVRPDQFKGLSIDQVQTIFEENHSVVLEKELNRMKEKEIEQEWANKQSEHIKCLEELELQKQQKIAEENAHQADFLQKQRQELKQKQMKMEKDKFGTIEYGFFQRFGTSCR